MQLRCRIFKGTGFNVNNIPDKPELIRQSATDMEETDPLDIVQDRYLSVIQVKGTWKNMRDADYVQLYDMNETNPNNDRSWWYAVDDIQMVNTDTVQLTLIEDFITSVGGFDNFTILDGETERVHITDDTFGKYSEDDPLCTPAMPLRLVAMPFIPSAQGYYVLLETTIDLVKQASVSNGGYGSLIKNPSDATEKVILPKIYGSNKTTKIAFATGSTQPDTSYEDRGTVFYLLNDFTTISQGDLNTLPDEIKQNYNIPTTRNATLQIGINEAWKVSSSGNPVLNCYKVPKSLVNINTEIDTEVVQTTFPSVGPSLSYDVTFSATRITRITPFTVPLHSFTNSCPGTMQFDYATVKNKRSLYGKSNKYGIITTAGNKAETLPENIYNVNIGSFSSTYPALVAEIDPRPDGAPYYNFAHLGKTYADSVSQGGYFISQMSAFSYLRGSSWEKVPLKFQEARGSTLSMLQYQASNELSNYNFATKQEGRYYGPGAAINKISDDVYKLTSATKALPFYGNATGAKGLETLANIAGPWLTEFGERSLGAAGWKNAREREAYAMSRRNELLNVSIPISTYIPEVQSMPESDFNRDIHSNGFLFYRYYLQTADLERIDRLLTMYGYRYTKALSASDFTNRKYFNFVKCNDVSVRAKNIMVSEGIAEQLKAGVRVWHVKPNRAYYNDNPVA